MSRARRLLRTLQRAVPPARGRGLTVLAYHLVGGGTDSAVDLPVDAFRAQMDELAADAEVVPLVEEVRRLAQGPGDGDGDDAADAGARPRVALTFDDAYRNFVEVAWPELVQRSLSATLFVPVGFVEGECPPPNRAAPLPAASWEELSGPVASGSLAVGSHTWTHRALPRLRDDELRDELRRSRERLERRLETTAASFCYPRGLWDRRVEARVAEAFDVAVVGGGGRNLRRRLHPLRVQRISLRRDGPPSLRPLLRSGVWLEERVADVLRRWRR